MDAVFYKTLNFNWKLPNLIFRTIGFPVFIIGEGKQFVVLLRRKFLNLSWYAKKRLKLFQHEKLILAMQNNIVGIFPHADNKQPDLLNAENKE